MFFPLPPAAPTDIDVDVAVVISLPDLCSPVLYHSRFWPVFQVNVFIFELFPRLVRTILLSCILESNRGGNNRVPG